MILAT